MSDVELLLTLLAGAYHEPISAHRINIPFRDDREHNPAGAGRWRFEAGPPTLDINPPAASTSHRGGSKSTMTSTKGGRALVNIDASVGEQR
jgi:hypothetical protein